MGPVLRTARLHLPDLSLVRHTYTCLLRLPLHTYMPHAAVRSAHHTDFAARATAVSFHLGCLLRATPA